MTERTLIQNYPHRMGGHCGSGAIRDLLHWQGLGWDGPPGEGLVFALGGALGLSYVRSSELFPPLYLVGRGADFEVDLPRRLGGHVEVLTTDDAEEGWGWVRDEADAGRPSLVWGDIAELPYLRVQLQMSRHDIVVLGYDQEAGMAFVVDNDRAEVQRVPLEALARARSSTGFPQPTRHCTYRITWPTQLAALAPSAADAFQQSAENMRRPAQNAIFDTTQAPVGADGLAASKELAADTKTWVDHSSDDLQVLLFSLGAFIEKAGTGGGMFRKLMADGATDIARLTDNAATGDLAEVAATCARAWSEVARAAVQRDAEPHARAEAVANAADRLPDNEVSLVEALEVASASLRDAGLQAATSRAN